MNTGTWPRPILLYRPSGQRLLDAVAERWGDWRARRRDRHDARAIDQLSSRTLADIGASDELIGQRRWQELSADPHRARSLYLYG